MTGLYVVSGNRTPQAGGVGYWSGCGQGHSQPNGGTVPSRVLVSYFAVLLRPHAHSRHFRF